MQDELEQRILDNPDDLGALAVYADWLTEQGDPRGLFLHLQLQLEDETLSPAQRQSLRDRERNLLQEHGRDWLGPLADALDDVSWAFQRGFLGRLEARELTAELARALQAGQEQLRWLRHFSVYRCWDEDEMYSLWDIPFPNVRTFHYGDGSGSLREEGNASMLAGNMPRLQELSVSGRRVQADGLAGLQLPQLRSLSISCAHDFATQRLAANPSLGNLQSIAFFPHALEVDDSQGYLSGSDLENLARSPHLRSLRSLTLWQCTAGDQGCQVLVDSGLLARLEELDLEYGEITDEGARILAGALGQSQLRTLRLNANSLTQKGVALLEAAKIPQLRVENQQQWGPERGYLIYGDCE